MISKMNVMKSYCHVICHERQNIFLMIQLFVYSNCACLVSLPRRLCNWQCVFVCLQNNLKTCRQILIHDMSIMAEGTDFDS